MYFIQSVLVSDEVVEEHFTCNIVACKGACCWEGDFGAPLEEEETAIIDEVYDRVEPLLTEAGKRAIAEQGKYVSNEDNTGYDTPLVDGAACAYMTIDGTGTAGCAFELAHNAPRPPEGEHRKTEWRKPISCHLYPIRVKSNKEANFEALNYDRWDICTAACARGDREKIRIYEFAKPALIRKYGAEWYEELEAAVNREEG